MAPHPSVTEVHGVSDYFEVDVGSLVDFENCVHLKGHKLHRPH